jgi:hypothetical protein
MRLGCKMRQQGPMKTSLIQTLGVVLFLANLGAAQDVIPLPTSAGPQKRSRLWQPRTWRNRCPRC